MTQSTDDTATRLTLLTRTDCHLCGPARDVVADVCRRLDIVWQEVNVDSDAELRAEYGDQVPAVLVDGDQVGAYRIDADELARVLARGR